MTRKILTWKRRQRMKLWLARLHLIVLNYSGLERRKILGLVRRVSAETHLGMDCIEGCQLYMAVIKTAKVEGDVAEVGVYRGGSAKIICEAKGSKTLHLFDTFEGIPEVDIIDAPNFKKGEWTGSLEQVQMLLKDYRGVQYYKGLFPETAGLVRDRYFSFVNLDVDTFKSTSDCLAFFYSHMAPGGVIVTHDYQWAAGVKNAVDKFFADKPEPVLELVGSQCVVVKTGGDL